MGLHTGEVEAQAGPGPTTSGRPLNRCARLTAPPTAARSCSRRRRRRSCGRPCRRGPACATSGAHRLKDLARPEHVFQLVHPDLPADVPAARGRPTRCRTTCPGRPPASSGGSGRWRRWRGCSTARRAHPDGRRRRREDPPGAPARGRGGRRRLSRTASGSWSWRRWPTRRWCPARWPPSSGVREEPGRPLPATLADALRAKRLLLVLDNCEHLVAACAALADALLRACPGAARPGDQPGAAGDRRRDALAGAVAVAAAIQPRGPGPARAEALRAVRGGAPLRRAGRGGPAGVRAHRAQRRAAVAEVCRRLDGIPLALELAAARRDASSAAEQIAGAAGDRFRLLTGGSRTALAAPADPAGHVDWSYDLLSERSRCCSTASPCSPAAGRWRRRRPSAPGRGWRRRTVLDAARPPGRQVAGAGRGGPGGRGALPAAGDAAAVRAGAAGRRAGRRTRVRQRHAAFFEACASGAGAVGPEQAAGSIGWRRSTITCGPRSGGRSTAARPPHGLRLGNALAEFWRFRGYLSEGRAWLHALLALPPVPADGRGAGAGAGGPGGAWPAARATTRRRGHFWRNA